MTRWALLVALGAVACQASRLAAPACAPPPSPIDSVTRAELVKARDAVWRAFYAGDSAQLTQILPERMVAMDEDRAAIIRDAQRFARSGRHLVSITFTCDEFFVSGNAAVVYSHYVAALDGSGGPKRDAGRAIEVFERYQGRWVNPSWHLDAEK